MVLGGISEDTQNITIIGHYLPAIAFGILHIQTDINTAIVTPFGDVGYLPLIAISLVIASTFHEFQNALIGPGNQSPDPQPVSTITRRIFYTIADHGKPKDHPEQFTAIAEIDIPRQKYWRPILIFIAVFLYFILYPMSFIQLLNYTTYTGDTLGGAVLFLMGIFAARWITNAFFPKAYHWDNLGTISVDNDLKELNAYSYYSDIPFEITSAVYDARNGGSLSINYQSTATDSKEEVENIETLVALVGATVGAGDYPIVEAEFTVKSPNYDNVVFQISGESIGEYRRSKANSLKLLNEVLETLEVK